MAGSSLPVTWRLPAVDVPHGAPVSEVVCVGYGGLDSYDFHGLETLQCMAERRKGGETGVVAVRRCGAQPVWKALATGSWDAGGCDLELFEACLCRSFTLTSPRPGYGNAYPELGQMPGARPRPDALPDRVCRRPEGHLADALGPGSGLHGRPADRRRKPAALDADVPGRPLARADAARTSSTLWPITSRPCS